ncbi:MAG TPA: hypothetical protein VGN20_08445 [Mucilaginibacter sp.]
MLFRAGIQQEELLHLYFPELLLPGTPLSPRMMDNDGDSDGVETIMVRDLADGESDGVIEGITDGVKQ